MQCIIYYCIIIDLVLGLKQPGLVLGLGLDILLFLILVSVSNSLVLVLVSVSNSLVLVLVSVSNSLVLVLVLVLRVWCSLLYNYWPMLLLWMQCRARTSEIKGRLSKWWPTAEHARNRKLNCVKQMKLQRSSSSFQTMLCNSTLIGCIGLCSNCLWSDQPLSASLYHCVIVSYDKYKTVCYHWTPERFLYGLQVPTPTNTYATSLCPGKIEASGFPVSLWQQ